MANWRYNPSKNIGQNWHSFAAKKGIAITRHSSDEERDQYEKERRAFITRWVNAGFRKHFGADTNKLEAWQNICETIGIEGTHGFSSIPQCKKVRDEALKPLRVKRWCYG
jgi:hypothetical protein